MTRSSLPPDTTLDALAGCWRIHQRARGHRWSVDDLLTAQWACTAAPSARTHLDLGCGIGSVLMLVAYRLRQARHVGVEAQEESWRLCGASLTHNGLLDRVEVRHRDFRVPGALRPDEAFDLVTGTPPYLPVGTATAPRDPQRAAARLELRGGVEAYLETGAAHLAEGGTLVLCGDGRRPGRTLDAARRVGLHAWEHVELVPLPGKPPLLHVMVFRQTSPPDPVAVRPLLARTADHRRTAEVQAIRAAFDMPPMPGDDPTAR
ncbi:MAG: methyltransferase domain-containing protein [Deltaproteobacteria bacterium]|nr:methyltransferase domain-containing protein [Deltaproteobacteria bacterium]